MDDTSNVQQPTVFYHEPQPKHVSDNVEHLIAYLKKVTKLATNINYYTPAIKHELKTVRDAKVKQARHAQRIKKYRLK